MVGGLLVAVVLVLACLGAGRAVLATERTPVHPPLADAIAGLTGLALLTALGGWPVLAGVYSTTAGRVLLAAGCLALLLSWARTRRHPSGERQSSRPVSRATLAIGLVTFALVLGRAAGELMIPFEERWDDWPSYWHFPRMLIESGGFIEPFNLRRLTTLGAAQFVQSFFWPGFRIAANGMTDALLGQLLLWAVVRTLPNALSTRPQPAWLGEALALAALLLSLTIPSGNSQPTLLPMAGALVLVLLTRRLTLTDDTTSGLRTAVAWGLVAAWLIGLRTSNVVFPAALWLVSALVAARLKDGRQGRRLVVAGLATTIALLPWCLVLWRSSGTPLYPLIAGNFRFAGGLIAVPLDGASLLALISDRLWMSRVWIIAALGALAALRPGVRLISIQVALALILLVAVSAAAQTGLDATNVHRLSAAFLAAGVVFFAAAVLVADPVGPAAPATAPRRDLRSTALWAGLALWFLMPVTLPADAWQVPASNRSMFTYQGVNRAAAAVAAWMLRGKMDVLQQEEYEAAQALLPADARIASVAERPYLFRFDRQVVHTLDFPFPGLVSPEPGMPSFKGAEALARYLRDLGYTHLAYTPSLFAVMRRAEEGGLNPWRRFREITPYFLDFMDSVEILASKYTAVSRTRELVIIDLRQPSNTDRPREYAW